MKTIIYKLLHDIATNWRNEKSKKINTAGLLREQRGKVVTSHNTLV